MNFHIKTKQKRNPKKVRALIVTGVFVVILFVTFLSQTGFFFGLFGFVGSPIWTTKLSAVTFFQSIGGRFQTNNELRSENEQLKISLSETSNVVSERDALQKENETLKGLFIDSSEGEIAKVVSNPAQSFFDVIVVTVKSDSDVRVGDFVWADSHVLLGTVLKRVGNLVHVELFSSIGKETSVRLGKDGTALIISGRGGGNFFVAAPRALPISENDVVSFSILPFNILARVRTIEEGRIDSFKSVYLTYPVNVFSLTWVNITHATNN